MHKWMLKNMKVDYKTMAQELGVNQILCKVMVNRGIQEIETARSFLKPDIKKLHKPLLLKDLEQAVEITKEKILNHKKIRIIGDYDVDGVISTYVLYRALSSFGAIVDYEIPHRIEDGYGINNNLIDEAHQAGIDTIITCDNGISALDQIKYAKSLGMTVIVTDHHDVPFVEDGAGNRTYLRSEADAIVNHKQLECQYPFKHLCGAAVAYKFLQALQEELEIDSDLLEELLQFVAIATVCDVVDLVEENRIIVKKGLELINKTNNLGLKSLFKAAGIEGKAVSVYTLGFVIGPCINASGRLDCAKKGLELLLSEGEEEATSLAKELHELNEERKLMTIEGVEQVIESIESTCVGRDKVYVVYKEGIHESIAGIIAGRIKDKYHVPTIVLTEAEDGVKGSARSIDGYNMFEELLKCKDLLTKFGGHPMAAGLSLLPENVELVRQRLNELTTLTEEELTPKVYIDAQLPFEMIDLHLAEELQLLEPFGKANSKPLFAEKNVRITSASILGANKNVLKLKLVSQRGKMMEGIYFGNIPDFEKVVIDGFGAEQLSLLYNGRSNNIKMDFIFTVGINEFRGSKSVQIVIQHYRIG
ncbi:single-stranded-DNA-specific exonuclease RecJ [Alkaliphilus hydrothermalis]|uniref:Single-stranded-DNA-specific exonuclease RecJ n=1 Tax=Alkaliphilus hydrothermalis TaxID=1482730 RepID=A0ABS2NM27_9FIRM|nr:single-stranded-DNA-specific exonuclease [Alkaliphilus hydrothermalis]